MLSFGPVRLAPAFLGHNPLSVIAYLLFFNSMTQHILSLTIHPADIVYLLLLFLFSFALYRYSLYLRKLSLEPTTALRVVRAPFITNL